MSEMRREKKQYISDEMQTNQAIKAINSRSLKEQTNERTYKHLQSYFAYYLNCVVWYV